MLYRTLLVAALLAAAPVSAWAQGLEKDPTFLCFRGGPASRCSSFLITEFAYEVRLNGPSEKSVSWEVGWMKNTGERWAFGGTVFYSPEDRLGVKSRVRWWWLSAVSVDVGAGVSFKNDVTDMGLTGHLGLNLADVLQVFTQVEVLNIKSGSTDTAWSVGAKGGSYVGLASAIVLLVGVATYAAGSG
jgi:hypothetical protein